MTDPPHKPEDAGLLLLFAGERAALLRFLAARCGDSAEAEDCLHELWLRLATLTPGPIANPRAYLFRMANNLVLDQRRTRQRGMTRDQAWLGALGRGERAPEAQADPAADAFETLAEDEELRRLADAIARLPAGAARALRLHRLEARPQAEVAAIMGISRSGVEKHLVTALRHLRRILGDTLRADCGSPAAAASPPRQPMEQAPPPSESKR